MRTAARSIKRSAAYRGLNIAELYVQDDRGVRSKTNAQKCNCITQKCCAQASAAWRDLTAGRFVSDRGHGVIRRDAVVTHAEATRR